MDEMAVPVIRTFGFLHPKVPELTDQLEFRHVVPALARKTHPKDDLQRPFSALVLTGLASKVYPVQAEYQAIAFQRTHMCFIISSN